MRVEYDNINGNYINNTYHILFHCKCYGLHAYSKSNLYEFNINKEQSWCNLTLNNGTKYILKRRERPSLTFNKYGNINYLYSAIQPPQGRTYNLVQSV